MVSDTELVNRLREILLSSDLDTTTAGAVRRQLESDFGVDLSDRKKFVSQQIDQFLQTVNKDDGDDEENADQLDDQQNGEQQPQEEEEDDGDDEEEEEGKRSKDEANKKKRGGFTRLCSLSPQLQEFLGVSEMARTEVVKQLWAYIREHDLQDPSNRRNIKCDKRLHAIFRVDTINMFQMNKALSKHIWPLEAEEETANSSQSQEKKQKRQKEETATNSQPLEKKQKRQKEGVKNSKQKSKQQKGGTSGFLKPLQLSDAFVKFLGTGETSLSRADAVKRMWDYIKQNDLQDPSDKRRILCDEKLKELLDVDSFTGFSVTKLLTAHFMKTEQ